MKKIKMLYDVAKTMKNMEKLDGVATIEVRKDQETIFSLKNAFEKNETGRVKANVTSKMNVSGEDLSRQSTTEFTLTGNRGPCTMFKKLHTHHHAADSHCGIRGVFQRISTVLGILGSLQVDEKGNGAVEISLDLKDIPEEIKTHLHEKMLQKHARHHDICCMQDCRDMELSHGQVVISVNEQDAIDRITVNLDGTTQDEKSNNHRVTATANVQFAW